MGMWITHKDEPAVASSRKRRRSVRNGTKSRKAAERELAKLRREEKEAANLRSMMHAIIRDPDSYLVAANAAWLLKTLTYVIDFCITDVMNFLEIRVADGSAALTKRYKDLSRVLEPFLDSAGDILFKVAKAEGNEDDQARRLANGVADDSKYVYDFLSYVAQYCARSNWSKANDQRRKDLAEHMANQLKDGKAMEFNRQSIRWRICSEIEGALKERCRLPQAIFGDDDELTSIYYETIMKGRPND